MTRLLHLQRLTCTKDAYIVIRFMMARLSALYDTTMERQILKRLRAWLKSEQWHALPRTINLSMLSTPYVTLLQINRRESKTWKQNKTGTVERYSGYNRSLSSSNSTHFLSKRSTRISLYTCLHGEISHPFEACRLRFRTWIS